MPSRRLRPAALMAGPLLAVLLAVTVPGPRPARAQSTSALQGAIAAQRARERNLAGGIGADSGQIARLGGSIAVVSRHLAVLQAQLAAGRAELASIASQEQRERTRLHALEAQLSLADAALARNLLSRYEGKAPDALTVILSAHGFADLLERVEFLQRASDQDTQVIAADRVARRTVVAEAERLGALEARAQAITAAEAQRSRIVDGLRAGLVRQQLVFVRARAAKAGAIGAIAARRRGLEAELSHLLAAEAPPPATRGFIAPASGHPVSAQGFTFPLPTGAVVGPGSWTQDQGVDMAAPGNTPEYAVGSGTIVLHGIGGFGPWAPVLHLDSPIDGQSYVYYGHAGPAGELPVGTHVGAGEVIGSIGPGIVGLSTGPHIEIGFADSSGTPAPGTSGLMLSLLHASYGA